MPTRHSGVTVGACSDPAYIPHHLNPQAPNRAKSRLEELIELGRKHPSNAGNLLPHRVIGQGPVFWIADAATRAMVLQSNDVVLGSSTVFMLDLHSACAGVIARTGMDRREDQRSFQTILALEHGPDLADSLAILCNHGVSIPVTYTQFTPEGDIYEVYQIETFESERQPSRLRRAELLPPWAKQYREIRDLELMAATTASSAI